MAIRLDASEARAVRLILKHQGLTRTDLAHLLGSSTPTVTGLVKGLIGSGVLIEDGARASTGGRPAAKLFVSDSIAYCCAHQMLRGRLTSRALDLGGEILGNVDRPVDDIAAMLRGVGAAELELSVRARNMPLIASGIVVPGIVDRHTNTGEAPWLFGKELIDPAEAAPNSLLISSAGTLTSKHEIDTSLSSSGPWLAIDMVNALSGLFLSPGGSPIPLDLSHLEPEPAIVLDEALDEAIRAAASRRSSRLGVVLAKAAPQDAWAVALRENDHVASALADRLLNEVLAFVRNLSRTLRPKKLILASNLLDPKFCLKEAFTLGLVRHAGVPDENFVLISPGEVVDSRFIGACAAALNLRLGDVERSNGTLKVE